MKKSVILIVFLIMFLPVLAKADTCDPDKITIESITLVNKSDHVTEIKEATAEGRNINLDITMSFVDDDIEYKMIVKNDSDEDYELDKTSFNINSDFIDYSLETEDETGIIKAKSSKSVILKIRYKTQVPETSFDENGIYTNQETMELNLVADNTVTETPEQTVPETPDKEEPEEITNPETGKDILTNFIILVVLLIISVIIYIILRKKKYAKLFLIIISTIISIPMCIYALCKCKITIDYKVTISKNTLSSFKMNCTGNDEYYFYEGMTFKDWIRSNLYPGNIGGDFSSIEECRNIWGNYKGCAAINYEDAYSFMTSKEEKYTDSKEECEDNENCIEVGNYYMYKYSYHLYDTLEECERIYGKTKCELKDEKYGFFYKYFYQTEEECTRRAANNQNYHPSCTLISPTYKYDQIYYENYETLEECERMRASSYISADLQENNNCFFRKIKHRNSPIYTLGTINGKFWFSEDGGGFDNNNYEYFNFDYNEPLTNTTYECESGA